MGKIRFDYGENTNNNLTIITDGAVSNKKHKLCTDERPEFFWNSGPFV